MNQDKYNGWTNRATWLINLWYEPNTISDLDWDELKEHVETEETCDV